MTMRSLVDEIQKSKGDEWELTKAHMKKESKSNQVGQGEVSCACDASTSAYDTRIDDMQDTIIRKDAKLNAMQNIIAVMENDVCVPYHIYAHIYTALEKIFGTLCQNGKYKQYLNLLTAGKDIRYIDIKCKILFKMKVLEKFCLALIAPCSQDFRQMSSKQDCSCYRAEIFTTFAITSAESNKNNIDNRRAQLVADIIENQEMKEILSKDSITEINNNEKSDENFEFETSSLETESKKRLKKLQENYDDLVNCYDNLKYEKDCLFLQCQKYVELEKECECMQDQLREYNQLWSEKEYYRKRSEDLDTLKERYYILSEETSNIESKFQAESEINKIKSNNINYLQNENLALEKKLSELTLAFQKEKNSLNCKLKECECKIMCQEQQIKTLSLQIDKFIEQGHDLIEADETSNSLELLNEIENQKEQIRNLRQALLCNEEEKQVLQNDIEEKLQLINELKVELENWKEKSDKLLHSNIFLEKYASDYQNQTKYLQDQNQILLQEVENKTEALENLKDIIDSKSKEISNLTNVIQVKKNKNLQLLDELKSFKNENDIVMDTLKTAQRESHEILANIIHNSCNESDYSISTNLKEFCNNAVLADAENKSNNSSVLLNEINKLHEISIQSLNALLDENIHYKESLEVSKKESVILEKKIRNIEELTEAFSVLTDSHENLLKEKSILEDELKGKNHELEDLINSFQLTKKESKELNQRLNETENIKEEYLKINALYQKLVNDRSVLQNELKFKEKNLENLANELKIYKQENEKLLEENNRLFKFENKFIELEEDYKNIMTEKQDLIKNIDAKSQQINQFYNNLERKSEENRQLLEEIELLKFKETTTQNTLLNNITLLENENLYKQNNLALVRKESEDLKEKLKFFENLQSDFKNLENTYEENVREKQKIQAEFNEIQKQLVVITEKNELLTRQNLDLLTHSEELENALISARAALNQSSCTPKEFLDEIKVEIEALKKEKIVDHKKIRDLVDRLDEADALISNLQEDIFARDSKISTLQNYINQLEEEVTHLNNNIAVAVESSEQLLNSSHKKIDDSLKILDAHHSKATHNMKMELTTLKNENFLLEHQLSNIKIKSGDVTKEKQKYNDEITDLSNERAITLEKIKELEIICLDNSSLRIDMCNIDDVITSLNRIRQHIEAKHSKSTSLEHTLFTVQNSSKLLLSKADEAKKIVENEKQKITVEKEEAVRERLIMEEKLTALETKLEDQMTKDQDIIKDLDAKLLNQKLMFEKIDEVRQKYITKLKNEIQNLQDMYENSLSKIRELQEKTIFVSEDNSKKNEEIEIFAKNLEKKSKEITFLRKCIDDIKNKPKQSIETQTFVFTETFDHSCQTNLSDLNAYNSHTNTVFDISSDQNENKQLIYNKEELLTTNSNLEFIKKTYLNYKIKQLRPTTLEQCTISCSNNVESSNNKDMVQTSIPNEIITEINTNALNNIGNHHNIIDIYNTHSIFTHNTEFSSRSPGMESTLELSNDNFENENEGNNQINLHKSKMNDISEPSTNNDLFLIYKDSDTDHYNSNPKTSWSDHLHANVFVESINLQSLKENTLNSKIKENDLFSNNDDDSVKPKLTLNLPRVGTDSLSRETHSICNNNSLDSYTIAIYASPMTASDIKVNVSEPQEKKSVTSFRPKNELNKNEKKYTPEQDIINVEKNAFSMNKEKKLDEMLLNRDDNKSYWPIVEKCTTKTSQMTLKKDDKKSSLSEHTRESVSNYKKSLEHFDYGLKYIMDSVQQEVNIKKFIFKNNKIRRSQSINDFSKHFISNHSRSYSSLLKSLSDYEATLNADKDITNTNKNRRSSFSIEQGVMVKLDNVQEYENKIKELTKTLENIERHYKNKIEAVKTQYDNNIKHIISEHNQGVESIQSLHEEALQDVIRSHEGEIENLRSMSIEAMRKVERLEKENNSLKLKLRDKSEMREEPIKIATDTRKRKHKRIDTKMLTTTNIEAFNVKPKPRPHGPCTCTLDANISDTIRTIFEQVDIDQRRLAEHAYTKYIATKIINNNVEALDAQELAFLHLKVCRTWKTMLSEEEVLQKRIISLESELLNKQRQTRKHIAELDRKVAEERQRLEEVREAVCRNTPDDSRDYSPQSQSAVPEKDVCKCCSTSYNPEVEERLSAGDLTAAQTASTLRPRRPKQESNRAVSAKLDVEDRKEKKHFHEEHPIRLRRSHDRPNKHSNKK